MCIGKLATVLLKRSTHLYTAATFSASIGDTYCPVAPRKNESQSSPRAAASRTREIVISRPNSLIVMPASAHFSRSQHPQPPPLIDGALLF